MIGLEYICKTYSSEYKELAKQMDISQPTIQDWLKGRRKIPKARLDQLSTIFKGIPAEYFQKELLKSEELEIQMIYLQHTDTTETDEVPITDDEGNIVAWSKVFYSAHAGAIDFLDNRQASVVLMEKVEELIAEDEGARRLIHGFLDILERGERNQIEFFTELLAHLNGKKETLFIEKYEDLEEYLKKYQMITDESAE